MTLSILFFVLAFIFIAVSDTIKFHWSTSIFYKIKNKKLNNWLNPDNYIYMYKNGDIYTRKEAFWGSSRWFAFLVDGWHMFKMLTINSFILSLTMYSGYKSYFCIILDTFIIYVIYGLVFELFFSKILK